MKIEKSEDKALEIFNALSDKTRIQIIRDLLDGEKACTEMINKFNLSKSTFSHHTKILARCGIIKFRRKGKFLYFSLDEQILKSPLIALMQLNK